MPLPPALAAKLAKRGIAVNASQIAESTPTTEEIIAEDYDDSVTQTLAPSIVVGVEPFIPAREPAIEFDTISYKVKGYEGCPNKYNIYHDCTPFCIKRWKNGIEVPSAKHLAQKERMLLKYPVPSTWKEVYDQGVGRFYYWDTVNDVVSWLPPSHPKAKPTEPAAVLREERQLKEQTEERDSDSAGSDGENEKTDEKEKPAPDRTFKRPHRHESHRSSGKRNRYNSGRTKQKDNDIDPMDPASYSDVPRGKWSAGLESQSEARTGADTTASGPLFQMRPYPSPGAILSANAKANKPKGIIAGPEIPGVN